MDFPTLSAKGLMVAEANIVQTNPQTLASVFMKQWIAGLMTGIWQGGNTWLTLEVGIGTATSSPPSTLGSPVLRKLVDSVNFVDVDGVTVIPGPSGIVQMAASLQTPDANGLLISEFAVYGGGLNLHQAPFGTGLLLYYSTITPVAKTSAFTLQLPVNVQV